MHTVALQNGKINTFCLIIPLWLLAPSQRRESGQPRWTLWKERRYWEGLQKKKSDITQYGLLQFAIIYFGTVTIDQNIRTINRNASSIKYTRRKKQYNLACSKPFIWHTAVFATPIALLEYFLWLPTKVPLLVET